MKIRGFSSSRRVHISTSGNVPTSERRVTKAMIGFEMRLPGGRECFVEVRNEWLGFGIEGDDDDREFFLGYLQATVSRKRGHFVGSKRKRLAIAAAFLFGLAVPVDYGVAMDLINGWVVKMRPSQNLVLEKSW